MGIKPQNILLTQEGFIKLSDLGISKSNKSLQYRTSSYFSPEMYGKIQNIQDDKSINYVKSDIYSLGMIGLEICNLSTSKSLVGINQDSSCKILNKQLDRI